MMKKPFTVKPKVTKKKTRIANTPHWTHASTIAERHRALADARTNDYFREEVKNYRRGERLQNMRAELGRLHSMPNLRQPGNEFYANRFENVRRQLNTDLDAVRAHIRRPLPNR
jgi:hypothetical protein